MTIKTASTAEVAKKTKAAEAARAAHAEAVEAADAAAELVTALEDGVRDSDESITHEHIAEQQSRAHWARLKADAAGQRAEAARIEAESLVSEALIAQARELLKQYPLDALATVYNTAVAATIAFANAYDERQSALDRVMGMLPEFDAGTPAHVRTFDGILLNPPPTEFDRSVLDVLDDARERTSGRHGNSPLDDAMRDVHLWGQHSAVRTAAANRH